MCYILLIDAKRKLDNLYTSVSCKYESQKKKKERKKEKKEMILMLRSRGCWILV